MPAMCFAAVGRSPDSLQAQPLPRQTGPCPARMAADRSPVDTPAGRTVAALLDLANERKADREPSHRDTTAHLGWAMREQACQVRERRHQAALVDYLP